MEAQFLVATYLLLQGDHTYLNLVTGSNSVNAFYYPEYNINLGPAVTPLASDVSQYLWNGVYRRDFQNGLVLVNPGSTSITVTLPGTYQLVQGTGGGVLTDASLNAQGQYVGGKLAYTQVKQVTLAPGSAAILLKSNPTMPPAPAQNLTAHAGNGQVTLSWSVPANKVVLVRQTGHSPTSANDGVQVYRGNQTPFVDTGLTNGRTYFYKLFTYTVSSNGTIVYANASTSPSASATPTAPAVTPAVTPAPTPAPQTQTQPPPVTPPPAPTPDPAPDMSWIINYYLQQTAHRKKKHKHTHSASH
jgi:hypothetical protein